MVLTPQLRQRIEMLQMTTLELSKLIQQELVENPILEEVMTDEEFQEFSDKILDQNAGSGEETNENGHDKDFDFSADLSDAENISAEKPSENGFEESGSVADSDNEADEFSAEKPDAFEEVDYGREFQDYLDPGYKTQEIEFKDDAPSFEQFLSRSASLTEHLEWQLNLLQISEKLEDVAVCVIGNLNDDGRLIASDEEIAEMCGCPVEAVEKARQVVLKLEPVGCGARNVKECLLAQLESNGEGESLAAELVKNHLEDLQPHRLQHLAKNTGIELHAVNEEINKIRILDPYPGRRYSSEEPIFVSPEVYIEKIEGDYIVYFTDDGSPRLRISQTYQKLAGENFFAVFVEHSFGEKASKLDNALRRVRVFAIDDARNRRKMHSDVFGYVFKHHRFDMLHAVF